MVGYQVLDPDTGLLLNELSWEDGPDPRVVAAPPAGVRAGRGSGASTSSRSGPVLRRVGPHRGGAARCAVRRGGQPRRSVSTPRPRPSAPPRARLVYLYWGEIDKVGHVDGCGSWDWCDELAAVDLRPADACGAAAVRRPAGRHRRPRHGRRADDRADSTSRRRHRPRGTRAGSRRAPDRRRAARADALLRAGRGRRGAARWRDVLADEADVLTRDEAVAAGWFGPRRRPGAAADRRRRVRPHRRRARCTTRVCSGPSCRTLIGMHGARTDAEVLVPAAGRRARRRLSDAAYGRMGARGGTGLLLRERWTAASRRSPCRWTTTTRSAAAVV